MTSLVLDIDFGEMPKRIPKTKTNAKYSVQQICSKVLKTSICSLILVCVSGRFFCRKNFVLWIYRRSEQHQNTFLDFIKL